MDKKIYPLEELGYYINSRFISVKIQFDSSKQDDERIKHWYSDAHAIMQNYHITAFPNFLFFSPDGRILHRDLGYKDESDFMAMVKDAQRPDKQYYTLLENYRKGDKDYASMGILAENSQKLGNRNIANELANDYINNYLLSLKHEDLFTKDNIMFIISFIEMLSSKDRFFSLFYPDGSKVDSVIAYKVSEQVVDRVITKEEIEPYTKIAAEKENGVPDWRKIGHAIKLKYNADYAERNILMGKLNWYKYATRKYNRDKDWHSYIKYKLQIADKYETDTSNGMQDFDHNNFAYEVIFFHTKDKKQINAGIKWMEEIVKKYPTDSADLASCAGGLDTYASLVYKAGRKDEAITIEEKAAQCDPKSDYYPKMVERMKKGETIWVQE